MASRSLAVCPDWLAVSFGSANVTSSTTESPSRAMGVSVSAAERLGSNAGGLFGAP